MNLNYVTIADLFIITIIMFGPQVAGSIQSCKLNMENEVGVNIDTSFSIKENIYAIVTQVFQFVIVLLYIYFRNINAINLIFNISVRNIVISILIFCLTGLLMDLAQSVKSGVSWIYKVLQNNIPVIDAFRNVNISLIVISLINGFYEEFFFLVICMAVKPEYSIYALIYALFIRIIIHLYQGKYIALTLGLNLGIVYIILYRKLTQNLFVFSFAHAIADVIGLSFVNLL